jgi:hypothetical protein
MSPFVFYKIFAPIAAYFVTVFLLQGLAEKTNTENKWFAWLPILNI